VSSLDVQAFLVTFREVLEAMLILGLITSYLKRMGQERFNKWVWTGAGFAVAASFLVALLFQVVLTGYATMGSEIYLKISIMIISSILLTQMVLWMAEQNRDVKSRMEKRLDAILTTGSIIGMIVHAFLVVLREGVETVFFFAAISKGEIDKVLTSWGALVGMIAAIVLSILFFRGTARFSLSTFFKVTGAMIILIAAGFLVSAIGMLQDLGHIPSAMPKVVDLAWLMPENPVDETHFIREHGYAPLISGSVGVFFNTLLGYTHDPSIEQIMAYIAYFVVVFTWVRYKKQSASSHSTSNAAREKNSAEAGDAVRPQTQIG
jgi:high-affinity iron transporter